MRKFILALAALLIFSAIGLWWWARRELRSPVTHNYSREYVEIPRGSSVEQIVDDLQRRGVVRRKWPLMIYLRATGGGDRLKAGEYTFPSPISPLQVLQKLEEGQQRLSKFTVIEGWTRWDIARALERLPEPEITEAEALKMMNDTSLIKDIDPQAENLEGYLYPDTYSFPPGTSPARMIKLMVERFKTTWQAKRAARVGGANAELSPRRVVTIASLIETEAKLDKDRPLVSSVIYNRLNKGMTLGIDSAVIYAAKLAGKWRDDGKVYQSYLDLNSPYNTRKTGGLPPGPVGSPGAASIDAALNPADTDYLFYVREPARNDGAHNFYADDVSFQRGVQALRNWEKQRDAGAPPDSPDSSASGTR